jgi:DNA polymerase-3 subunit epsilon
METTELKKMATLLRQSDQYRVIEKYQKPEAYNEDNHLPKLIGVFLDIEATGLSFAEDKIIELGMVKFEYTEDGRIFRLLDEFSGYQDPHMPLTEFITKLTGITDQMVTGQQIYENEVADYLKDVDLVIAHNAPFDRNFFEKTFTSIPPMAWACSMYNVNWNLEDINSKKLEYIAYKYGFFYEGHRAVIDCLAGIHVLAQALPISKQLVLKQLLSNANQVTFKLWATNAPYAHKDLLKERGYRWSTHQASNYKAWAIELPEDTVEAEINFLRTKIYNRSGINIPIEVFDANERFSSNKGLQASEKHQDKLNWAHLLCIK